MNEPITGALARILEENRGRYNVRVKIARSRYPTLDEENFGDVLRTLVQPLVELVDEQYPARTTEVVDAFFDITLELCGREIFASTTRYPMIRTAWQTLFPSLVALIVIDPRHVAGAISNAIYTLSEIPSANPMEWITRMQAAAPLCADIETFLRVGQISAWQVGLAQYRWGALNLCQSLAPALVKIALGISHDSQPVDQVIARMHLNPWYQPGYPENPQSLKIVKRVGAFRGFGGLFVAPPVVYASEGAFAVTDGESTWLLHADAFGATFHHVEFLSRSNQSLSSSGFRIVKGTVYKGTFSATFPDLETVTSLAANETTLAVTTPYSHAITLVAMGQDGNTNT